MDFQPAISPDGKSIAFLHYLGDPTGLGVQAEIHVVNADGTNEHKVADCACDGRSKIAYYRDGSILYGYVRTLEAGGIDANLMKVKDGQAPEVWIKGAGPHVIHANASGGLVVNGPALVDFAKGMIGPTLPDLGGTVEDFFQITSARVYYEFKDTPGLNGEIHSVALAGGSPRKEPFSPVASTQVGFYGNDFVVADDDSFAILETPGTDGKHESLSAYTVANGVATPQSIPGLPAQIEQGQYFGVTIGLGP
jgi:hypothetical protein